MKLYVISGTTNIFKCWARAGSCPIHIQPSRTGSRCQFMLNSQRTAHRFSIAFPFYSEQIWTERKCEIICWGNNLEFIAQVFTIWTSLFVIMKLVPIDVSRQSTMAFLYRSTAMSYYQDGAFSLILK